MNEKVAVLILNWNNYGDTAACIESFRKQTYPDYNIIVLDNNSDQHVYNLLLKEKDILIIRNSSNLGYAGGNNVGLKYALEELDCQYILIVNNDTIADVNLIGQLVKVFEQPGVGIVCPAIYYYDDRSKIQFFGENFNWYSGNPSKIKNTQDKTIVDSDIACGACMLIKREVIEKVGYLTEDYFLLWEDLDYSVRVKRSGYKILCTKKATIWHKVSTSIGKVSNLRLFYSMRNRIIFLRRHSNKIQLLSSILFFMCLIGPFSLVILLKNNPRYNTIKNFLLGLIGGFKYKI